MTNNKLISDTFSPIDFIRELWLLNRSLVSDDFDKALARIADFAPLQIHSFPSGSSAFDWIIPDKWENNGGGVYGEDGKLLIDLGSHPLHIAAGSKPFKGKLSKEIFLQQIIIDQEREEAIPYKTSYYSNDWKICLSKRDIDKLTGDSFYLEINTKLYPGELKLGEIVLPGNSEEIIAFPIHLDHPGQCNDNLSGVAVAVELIKYLMKRQSHYTLIFLFLPESIGSYAYLSANEELVGNIKYAITFDSIGAGGQLFFMRSVHGNSELDTCARLALKELVPNFREYGFLELEGYGNDERAFQAPGICIPAISISRYPYPEYHSSLDTPDIIDPNLLIEARNVILRLLEIIDRNFIPKLQFKGVPQFSKRGLWIDFSDNPVENKAIEMSMYITDGIKSIASIAEYTNVPFDFALTFFLAMEKHNLITRAIL